MHSVRSSPSSSSRAAVARAVRTRLSCVRTTPFGAPVVPGVYRIAQGSRCRSTSVGGISRPRPLAMRSSNWKIPVVVPEIFLSDRHHVLKVRQTGEEALEALEIVHTVPVLGRDRDGGLGIPQRETQLASGTVRTDGHEDGAGFRDRESGDHEFRPVGQLDRDAVAGFDSQVVKPHGQGARLRRDAGIAPRPVPRPYAGRVRAQLRVSGEEIGDAERGGR